MNNLERSYRNYIIALRDIYLIYRESSNEEKRDLAKKITKVFKFPFWEAYEHIISEYYKRGLFPFQFFFFPPHPQFVEFEEKYGDWPYEFNEVLSELEREFQVGENNNQDFSPGERQISRDVQYLSNQFMKLTETSAKLEQEVFRISFIKDLPKNVVGHITEDGKLKLVEPKTNKEWDIANLNPKEKSLKEKINELIKNNKGRKKSFIEELKLLLNENTLEV
jgi:hypothetical protein